MKLTIQTLIFTFAAALIAGCSDELDRGDVYKPEKGINATIPAYPFADGTRVNISDDLQTFTWSDGDKLGLYYQGSNSTAHAAFSIISGGGSTGNFENEAFILKESSTYYAFYPFSESATIASAPVDFTGQVQNGNGSAAHLGAYNYMYSTVNTDASGNANIQFKNLGSVMQLQLTVSNAATYTGIDVTSDGTEFITKGTASMVDGSVTATETSHSIHLDFKNGILLNEGDVLTVNILTAPVDLSCSNLTLTLLDEGRNTYELSTVGKNMLQGKAYIYEGVMEDSNIPYVTFHAEAEQYFSMSGSVSTLEYSINNSAWAELSCEVQFGGEHGDLRLRGKSSLGTNGSRIYLDNTVEVACSGDIRTLIDYENYDNTDTSGARFYNLFAGCKSLTQAPELPAVNLAERCYQNMFSGCTSLKQAPELPAAKLAPSCYHSMFSGCISLTEAPRLPAISLADHCYYYMFRGCTSLADAPVLPATKLEEACYLGMFSGCTSLTQAPELLATTLANYCYADMFWNCNSLKESPGLPAIVLYEHCYRAMFGGCTSLISPPELPATNLAEACYLGMFSGCTSLTQAPELPATTLASSCYSQMFYECPSLTTAPDLPATILSDYCYESMFYCCNNLNYIRIMAIDINSEECLTNWVEGVSSTGTFVKNKDATWDETEYNIIPSGWTVVTE